jgi:folate-dependent phosphoribosylglycinamide formyltransferase PurN
MYKGHKIGFALGNKFSGTAEEIYSDLKQRGLEPDFVIFTFPTRRRIKGLKKPFWVKFALILLVTLLPGCLLRLFFFKYMPKGCKKLYSVKDINSRRAITILAHENPRVIVIYSCGHIMKKTCELFHNVLINAHAGKLPEYRGVNNIEWAYIEHADLYGTIQYTAPLMDTGDIIIEKRIEKIDKPDNIEQIREDGFRQTFSMIPDAVRTIIDSKSLPRKQNLVPKTNRYAMHPFIQKKLEQIICNN